MAIALQTQLGSSAMANEDFLKFSKHDLNIQAYSASDVEVLYAGTPHKLSAGKLAPAKTEKDQNKFPNFKSGTYVTFAGPVDVKWSAADGSKLAASLNLDEIFKDRRVLHTDDASRLYKADPVAGGHPTIIIEVNDRTLNMYMLVTIRLEKDATTREHHDHRTLAYSKTY
ncbi:MAG: hypothetical protein HYR68_11835 [Burkholderiales bacterium]|nr:hypothetical protein [Burkholderiales bacterium]